MKIRGYRWSGLRCCSYIDFREDRLENELALLHETVFGQVVPWLPTQRITARDRFSARTNPDASTA